MSKPVLIVGTGAQAKYATEIFKIHGIELAGFLTISENSSDSFFFKEMILGGVKEFETIYLKNKCPRLLLCTSNNKAKEYLLKKFSSFNPIYKSAIHPASVIASTVSIGQGSIINAGAIIQPFARIGNHVMIHAGAIIEHDSVIDNYVNIAPNATITGHVKIGKGSTVYAGATINPMVKIGEYAVIASGAVVIKDVKDKSKVIGIPAREI